MTGAEVDALFARPDEQEWPETPALHDTRNVARWRLMREYAGKPVIVTREAVEDWPQERVLDFRTLAYAETKAATVRETHQASASDAKSFQQSLHAQLLRGGQGVRV